MPTPSKYSLNRVGIRNSTDYSPFGVELDGRTVSVEGYRFGYQGSEKDNEFKGEGNSYTTEFRQLDPRLGRWLSVDPVIQPWQSSYCSMDNIPIRLFDNLGTNTTDWIRIRVSEGGQTINKPIYDSGIHDNEAARAKYGKDAYVINDGFQYTANSGQVSTLLEGGQFLVDGVLERAQDLNDIKINFNEDKSDDSKEDNSIMRELIGATNTKHHNDWYKDPSKHHYMYDFDNSFQKGFTYTMLGATSGLLAIEAAPLAIGAYSYISNTSLCKLGANYLSESISNSSFNPLDHNTLSYLYAGMAAGSLSFSEKMLIGASSGLVEYKLYSNELTGIWNQNMATSTLKAINGATAPIFGTFYGDVVRQGIGGYGINQLEKNLKE
jgi:RHS repeat-associated protein